jgi:hypothetical protein
MDLVRDMAGVARSAVGFVPVPWAGNNSETDSGGNCDRTAADGAPRLRIGRSNVQDSLKSTQF